MFSLTALGQEIRKMIIKFNHNKLFFDLIRGKILPDKKDKTRFSFAIVLKLFR